MEIVCVVCLIDDHAIRLFGGHMRELGICSSTHKVSLVFHIRLDLDTLRNDLDLSQQRYL